MEAQEKKISSLELSRKLTASTGSEPMAKKLMELQESEKQRKKLEEVNLKLRIQLDDQASPSEEHGHKKTHGATEGGKAERRKLRVEKLECRKTRM